MGMGKSVGVRQIVMGLCVSGLGLLWVWKNWLGSRFLGAVGGGSCMARLKVASKVKTPDFSINEVKHAVSKLKTG